MRTHRERLQKAIEDLQNVQDEIRYLRDHATLEMKEEYNKVIEYLPLIWAPLQKVDNKLMPNSLAQEKL
jgi:predicted metal-dependent hydrolase